jgi:DNA-binding response OmpR family regulator
MTESFKGRPSLKYQLAGTNPQRVGQAHSAAAGPRVLVVDDDPDMTRLVGAALSSAGFECLAAYDALQGMVVAQREAPALIIVDLHMPAGGGLKLLEKLRASLKTASIPVLVVTADTASDLPARATALGARGFLHKPLDLAHLVDSVRPHLDQAAK